MKPDREYDLAAGGLLVREDRGSLELAVVHRGRRADCSLPKGHPEPGESLRETALREVREETGCEARIGELVQPLSYLAKGVPKLVVFYRMRFAGEVGQPDPDEVERVEWLTPERAVRVLTHAGERALVAKSFDVPLD